MGVVGALRLVSRYTSSQTDLIRRMDKGIQAINANLTVLAATQQKLTSSAATIAENQERIITAIERLATATTEMRLEQARQTR